MRTGRMRRWGWGWVAGAVLAVWVGTAGGAGLDVGGVEETVRRDVAVFGVATGAEGAVLTPELRSELGVREARALAGALWTADTEAALALYGELARRELSWEERLGVLHDLPWWHEYAGETREQALQTLEAWGMPIWEAWTAGEIPEELTETAVQVVYSFCSVEWVAAMLASFSPEETEEEAAEASEKIKLWEERTRMAFEEMEKVLEEGREGEGDGEEDGAGGGTDDGTETSQKPETRLEAASPEGGAGGKPGSVAEWHFRRGMEMSELGRKRDAEASWRETERLAEEAGDAALLREVRAARAVDGDWRWRRAERRALCEAELEAGSSWREPLLRVLAEEAERAGDVTEAVELVLAGWWEYGGNDWARWAGDLAAKGGVEEVALWHRVCGERLEEIPAVEGRREEIVALVEFRWAMGALFPGRVEDSLEGDLARLRARAGEGAGERDERDGRDGRDGGAGEDGGGGGKGKGPGGRWRGGASWRTDPRVPEIEREFNELVLGWRTRPVDAWASWREKWSEEERRVLKVDGVEAEFASWADEICHATWHSREESKPIGLRALEEAKRQERYDAGRLMDVLWKLGLEMEIKEPADAAQITEWTEWARRVAAGDAEMEELAAVMELNRASQLDDEAAVRRLAGDERTVAALCELAYGGPWGSSPWMALARWSGEREAVRLAILNRRLADPGWVGPGLEVDALMDAMTAEELESLQEARRLRALAEAAPVSEGPVVPVLPRLAEALGHRRERGWRNPELQLRLARLEAQGADGGAEGQELAKALGEASVRGSLARWRWRMGGGRDAEETAEEAFRDSGTGEAFEGGRWRDWCACMRKMSEGRWEGGGRHLSAVDGGGYHFGNLPPWLDRMVLRGLREALAGWGADATEEEAQAIAAVLKDVGFLWQLDGEGYGEWLEAARAAGPWASAALEARRAWRAAMPEEGDLGAEEEWVGKGRAEAEE